MPNTKEINIGLNRFESTKAYRIFLVLMVMMMFYVSCGNVEASDDTHDQETAITLIVDADTYDEAQLEATIDTANSLAGNGDIEKAQVQEITPGSLTVVIGSRDNVRSLGDNFGNVDSSYPRGNYEVIGYFTDGPLQSIAGGTWLVLEGGQHAVYSGVVNEPDGSGVTDADAATTQLYEYDGSAYVPVVEAEAAPDATGDGDGDDDEVATPNPTATELPDGLAIPEITHTVTATHYDMDGEFPYAEYPLTETTIDINQDSLLPFPLGIIPEGTSDVTDMVDFEGEPDYKLFWERETVSGIILSIYEKHYRGDEFNYVEILTQTPGGNDVVMTVRLSTYIRFIPTTDMAQLAVPLNETEVLWNANNVADDGVITAPTRDLIPGDHIIIDINNVDRDAKTPTGANRFLNAIMNKIGDGSIHGVFEAIDSGEIEANGIDTPFAFFFGGYHMMYNQD